MYQKLGKTVLLESTRADRVDIRVNLNVESEFFYINPLACKTAFKPKNPLIRPIASAEASIILENPSSLA